MFSLRSFLYLFYAVLLTTILLYVRFPTEKFKLFCEQRLELVFSGRSCTIGSIGYKFPAAVEFNKVRIGSSVAGVNNAIILDKLSLSPAFKGPGLRWKLGGELYLGGFDALLVVKLAEKIFTLSDISLKNIDIGAIGVNLDFANRDISGNLTFSGEYKAKFARPLAGTGRGELQLRQGSFQLVAQVLTLYSIDFKEINISWKLAGNVLQITAGKMTGKQLDADFAGTLQAPFLPPEGALNVNGFLSPKEQFLIDKPQIERLVQRIMQRYKKSAVPFRVGGTLNKPTFRLSM